MNNVIEILNWEEHAPRKDIVTPGFFRVPLQVFFHPAWFGFDGEQKCVWMYLLALATYSKNPVVIYDPEQIAKITGCEVASVLHAVEKLEQNHHVRLTLKVTYAPRTPNFESSSRKQNRTEQYRTEQNMGVQGEEPPACAVVAHEGLADKTTDKTADKGGLDTANKPSKTTVAAGILAQLAAETGRKFRPTPGTLKHIQARLAEGYTELDLKVVIWAKTQHWLHDDKFSQYLRPQTLFNSEKFPGYLAFSMAKAEALDRLSKEVSWPVREDGPSA